MSLEQSFAEMTESVSALIGKVNALDPDTRELLKKQIEAFENELAWKANGLLAIFGKRLPVSNVKYTVPDYRLTPEERETHIFFDESGSTATVETFNKAMIRKLDEYAAEDKRIFCVKSEKHNGFDDLVSKEYCFPKSWLKVHKPVTRSMTEEQKKQLAEMGRRTLQNLRNQATK